MTHTRGEIIKSLEVIKDVCNDHFRCEECPFYDPKEFCLIKHSAPIHWQIRNYTNKILVR